MKSSALLFLLAAGILVSGCASHKQKTSASVPTAVSVIITPDASLAGKVVSFNEAGRFVVLNFPVGRMPKAGQSLFLYRNGLKVAEVKTDTRQLDNLVVADLVTGDAQAGDEARDQ
ncbi:MAG: hypothetical protein ABSE90_09655 [Verrucomicrobiota bacterium]|jgi:hypothetical protein